MANVVIDFLQRVAVGAGMVLALFLFIRLRLRRRPAMVISHRTTR